MAPVVAHALSISASTLASTSTASAEIWKRDLKTLFDNAKDRFPDVVWELSPDDDSRTQEDVWGHKAIVYSRAPPSFLAQYFDVRPNGSSRIFTGSPLPGDNPTQSNFSLGHEEDGGRYAISPLGTRQSYSPAPTTNGSSSVLRLTTDVAPALFANQLEYLYTGSGIGHAFEFLFDGKDDEESTIDVDSTRIDSLRKDLTFMWRSRLYADVRIELSGFSSGTTDDATAVFSCHRFILASRSSYFRSLFLSGSFAPLTTVNSMSPITISLPSPPFTPASLHFTLGYIYTGTLFFSNRTYDLDTSFHIYRSGMYLSLTTLVAEIEARIVEEMMHGLFHAYLTFEAYEKVTGGRWGVGGCKCKTCARRVPRVLDFSLAPDVTNSIVERGARRALVGIFGEGWVTSEFASLTPKVRATALKGVQTRTTVQNIFPLLFASEAALTRLEENEQDWADSVREQILVARKKMDEVLCGQAEECFEQEEWLIILERDGSNFNDGDRVHAAMDSVRRGLTDSNAGVAYQVLVSSILLRARPDSTEGDQSPTLLSPTSSVRAEVERTRLDIIRWLRKRWISVRIANGFETLEGWALKEISDELDVPVEDLLSPAPQAHASPARTRKPSNTRPDSASNLRHTATSRDADTASISAASLRASVLNRNAARAGRNDTDGNVRDSLASSRSSVVSSTTVSSIRTTNASNRPTAPSITSFIPPSPSVVRSTNPPSPSEASPQRPIALVKPGATTKDLQSPPAGRPKSLAPSIGSVSVRSSVASVRSTASNSTLRRAGGSTTQLSPATGPRSARSRSPKSEASTSYQTAPSSASGAPSARVRTTSALSNVSASSVHSNNGLTPAAAAARKKGPALTVPIVVRQRRTSATSVTSTKSATAPAANSRKRGAKSPPAGAKSPAQVEGKSKERQEVHSETSRPKSTASVASGRVRQTKEKPSVPTPVPSLSKAISSPQIPPPIDAKESLSQKDSTMVSDLSEPPATAILVPISDTAPLTSKPPTQVPQLGHVSHPSDGSTTTVRMVPILSRKTSSDTITKSVSAGSTTTPRASQLFTPRASIAHSDDTDSAVTAPPPPIEKDHPSSPLNRNVLRNANQNIDALVVPPHVISKPSHASLSSAKKKNFPTPSSQLKQSTPPGPPVVRGITLNIGIPCMISSKRSRFKAFARYIGEIAGEEGPWIGVEVPVSDDWSEDRLNGRDWNDGSVGGVRYFEIGGSASLSSSVAFDEGEERAARRRRMDAVLSASLSSASGANASGHDAASISSFASSMNRRKREGDALLVEQDRLKRLRSISPAASDASSAGSRGLFVRPAQVLLVIDAKEH